MLYIDIDGVLNNYPETYIGYLSDGSGSNFSTLFEAKCNIPYSDYIAMRSDYRKTIEPCLVPNQRIITALNFSPYENIIVTKRPIHQISHLNNTMYWLKKSGLRYQHIVYWNKNPNDLNIPFEVQYCRAAVEDNIKIALLLEKTFSMKVFVLKNEENKNHSDELKGTSIWYGDSLDLGRFLKSF